MKLVKRLTALFAAVLLTVTLAVPASAHHGHGNCPQAVTAVRSLHAAARAVARQARASGVCVGAIGPQAGKLAECRAACAALCPNNGVCDGTGNGYGNGVCDGTGNGYGNGVCNGTGMGQGYGTGYGGHHGGGHGHHNW